MIGEGHRPWRLVWTSAYRAGAMTLADYRHGGCCCRQCGACDAHLRVRG
jgi:hypothetical protein